MEAVERRNFFADEFEVEDLCILRDPVHIPGFADNDDLMPDRASKQYVCKGKTGYQRMSQSSPVDWATGRVPYRCALSAVIDKPE